MFFRPRRDHMKALVLVIMLTAAFACPPIPLMASERIVYVIESFNDGLYHMPGCCSLYGQKVKGMTRSDAQKEHRLPCDWCHPDFD